jgi:hypothetical protein
MKIATKTILCKGDTNVTKEWKRDVLGEPEGSEKRKEP